VKGQYAISYQPTEDCIVLSNSITGESVQIEKTAVAWVADNLKADGNTDGK
jgi:hypothetical protein